MKLTGLDATGGLTLEPLRLLCRANSKKSSFLSISVRQLPKGYGIHFEHFAHEDGWLISEHTRQVRGFARVEAALNVCRQLGLKKVELVFASESKGSEPALPEGDQ